MAGMFMSSPLLLHLESPSRRFNRLFVIKLLLFWVLFEETRNLYNILFVLGMGIPYFQSSLAALRRLRISCCAIIWRAIKNAYDVIRSSGIWVWDRFLRRVHWA
jgi:hypothetical protein